MLRNPIYIGRIEWRGESFRGVHQPLVSSLTWNNVQELLDRRSVKNTHGDQLRFAFTGLITCGHCGCAVVAQMQKKRYVYYHCSGFRQKCPEKYVREETLVEAFAQQLARLQVDDEIFSLIERAIVDAQRDEDKGRNEEIMRLKAEADRLQVRMDKLYVDHLEGRIPADMYDRLASEWRDERMQSLERLEGFREVDDALIGDGIELLDLARKAHQTFVLQSPSDKISVLKLLLSNCTWPNGELTVEFREPFAMLEKISPGAPALSAPSGGSEAECPNWLPE
nr:recombinase zinc beta ribbon domain-containing protein [Sphingobium yanoikuyae]